MALALGTFGQGLIDINNSSSTGGIKDDQGNWYGGAYGLEIWELNAASVPAGINGALNTAAYDALTTAGFKKEATLNGTIGAGSEGVLSGLAPVTMADVSPAGSTVVLALAMWNNSSTSWANMASGATAATRAGVIAFVNATANPAAQPPPIAPPLDGWTDNLVLTPIPEPSMFALAGLGAAALLIFRRRK